MKKGLCLLVLTTLSVSASFGMREPEKKETTFADVASFAVRHPVKFAEIVYETAPYSYGSQPPPNNSAQQQQSQQQAQFAMQQQQQSQQQAQFAMQQQQWKQARMQQIQDLQRQIAALQSELSSGYGGGTPY